ncbi:MAG: arginase [Proteobacteria bacterium]|nr:arginase [Pseudomonadota bacterium]
MRQEKRIVLKSATSALGGGPLALIGAPFGHGGATRGAELGPAALRLSGLVPALSSLGRQIVDLGDVTPEEPRSATPALGALGNEAALVSAWATAIHDTTLAAFERGQMPLVLGGDHSIAMGSASAAARHAARTGRRLMLLWIDAHADFNCPRISPSGNLHGMSLAMLAGDARLGALLGDRRFPPVRAEDVHLIGARSLDSAEKTAIAEARVACLDMRVIDEFGICALLRRVLSRVDPAKTHLHVSFDIDVVDPALAPGTGTKVAGGLTYREAHLVMEMLHESGLVGSADLVEVNPMLDHEGQTARLAVDLVASLFGKAISLGIRSPRETEEAA